MERYAKVASHGFNSVADAERRCYHGTGTLIPRFQSPL